MRRSFIPVEAVTWVILVGAILRLTPLRAEASPLYEMIDWAPAASVSGTIYQL